MSTDIVQPMRFEIDLDSGLVNRPQRAILMKGDRSANRIIAALTKGGAEADLEGVTVTGTFARPGDGAKIMLEGEAENNEARVLLRDECYEVEGLYEATVDLTRGETSRTILKINGRVQRIGSDEYVEITGVIPSVEDIVAQYGTMQQVTQDTQDAAAEARAEGAAAQATAQKAANTANAAASAADAARLAIADDLAQLSESKAEKSELVAERARIDNLLAGGTVGDGELLDVRVGYDGTTYDSAGEAVRAQMRGISGTVAEQSESIDELSVMHPDTFEGTDSDKIQACMDALEETGGVIVINRTYTLDKNVIVAHSSDDVTEIFIIGIGKGAKIDFGAFSFISSSDAPVPVGGLRFSNLNLLGSNVLYDGGTRSVIRIHFTNATISGFKYILYSTTFMQNVHFTHCTIRNISQYFLKIADEATGEFPGRAFDIKFCGSVIEWSCSFFDVVTLEGAAITDNCIEGFYGIPFIFDCLGKGVHIAGNYFEANGMNYGGVNIDLTNTLEGTSVNIANNFFAEYTGASIIKVPSVYTDGQIFITGNHSADRRGTLIVVPDDAGDLSGVYAFANIGVVRDRHLRLRQQSVADGNAKIGYTPQTIAPLARAQARNNIMSADIASEFLSTASGEKIKATNVLTNKLLSMSLYGKTIQTGDTSVDSPATFESSGVSGEISVKIGSKNIFGGEALANAIADVNTGTTIDTESGIITFRGNAWATEKTIFNDFEEGKQYTIVIKGKNSYTAANPGSNTAVVYTDGTIDRPSFTGNEVSTIYFVTNAEKSVDRFVGTTYGGTTSVYYNESGIFEGVITEADFVQYGKQEITPTFTGTLSGITTNKLWDYVDDNGVGWVADKIDFLKGTHEAKIVHRAFNGSEDWEYVVIPGFPTAEYAYITLEDEIMDGVVMCDRFDAAAVRPNSRNQDKGIYAEYKDGKNTLVLRTGIEEITDLASLKAWLAVHPITVLYARKKPVVTKLAAETTAAYNALQLYTPETKIEGTGNIGMTITYMPDTIAGRFIRDLAERIN